MNTQNLVYIVFVTALLILVIPAHLPAIQSQEGNKDVDEGDLAPTGQVVNSKYLMISGVTFNEDDNQVNIAGTIANNSTDQSFANVSIVGQLYDEENRMITASSGIANLANLGPGQQSAFTITTNLPSDEEVTRYIVLPGGSAVQ
jgi:hypothetical protein